MSRVEFPFPRDFPGDGVRVERDVSGGRPAMARRLRGRLVHDGERTYRAYSADELLEIQSLATHGRPGVPY